MGNIISYFLDRNEPIGEPSKDKDGIVPPPGERELEPDETPANANDMTEEDRQAAIEDAKKREEDKAKEADNTGPVETNIEPAPTFVPYDFKPIKNAFGDLDEALSEFTDDNIWRDIQTNIVTYYLSTLSTSLGLMLDLGTFVSADLKVSMAACKEKPDNQTFESLVEQYINEANSAQFDVTSIMKKCSEMINKTSEICSKELASFKKTIETRNKTWHTAYDEPEIVKLIKETLKSEYLAKSDQSVLTNQQAAIKSVIDESDAETAALLNLNISGNAIEALTVMNDAFENLYDLEEDQKDLDNAIEALKTWHEELKRYVDNMSSMDSTRKKLDDMIIHVNDGIKDVDANAYQFQTHIETVNDVIEKSAYIPGAVDSYRHQEAAASLKDKVDAIEKAYNEFDASAQAFLEIKMAEQVQFAHGFAEKYGPIMLELQEEAKRQPTLTETWITEFSSIDVTEFDGYVDEVAKASGREETAYEAVETCIATLSKAEEALTGAASSLRDDMYKTHSANVVKWSNEMDGYVEALNENASTMQAEFAELQTVDVEKVKNNMATLNNQLSELRGHYTSVAGTTNEGQRHDFDLAVEDMKDAEQNDFNLDTAEAKYKAVKTLYDAIIGHVNDSNELVKSMRTLIEETAKLIKDEEDRLAKAARLKAYNEKTKDVRVEIIALLDLINNTIDPNLAGYEAKAKELDESSKKLFEGHFEELRTITNTYPNNEFAVQVQASANQAFTDKATLLANVAAFKASIESIRTRSNSWLAIANECNTELNKDDVDERMDADALLGKMKEIDKDQLQKDYESAIASYDKVFEENNNVATNVAIAYMLAGSIDPSFKEYSYQSLEVYKTVLETYKNQINQYNANAVDVMKTVANDIAAVQCMFVNIHNELKDDQKEYPENCEHATKDMDLKKILSELDKNEKWLNSSQSSTYGTLRAKIDEEYKGLEAYVNQIREYEESYSKIQGTINSDVTTFNTNCDQVLKGIEDKSINIDKAQEFFKSAISSYANINDKYKEMAINVVQQLHESANGKYSAINDARSQLVTIYNEVSILKLAREREATMYGNAAVILAMIYGHYYSWRYLDNANQNTIDGKEWRTGLKDKVIELLTPEGADELLVFKGLCSYAPILPVVWPWGDRETENRVNSKGTSENSFWKQTKDELIQYVKIDLPIYICRTIELTMDKTVNSDLEKQIDAYVGLVSMYQGMSDSQRDQFKKDHPDYASCDEAYQKAVQALDKASTEYIKAKDNSTVTPKDLAALETTYKEANDKVSDMEARITASLKLYESEIRDKAELNVGTLRATYFDAFIDQARQYATSADSFTVICKRYLETTGLHNYWKLLKTCSLKKKGTNVRYVPVNFPRINPETELREAIIIVMNRIFSVLGKITMSDLDDNGKSKYVTLTQFRKDSLTTEYIHGGQCITYDDTNAYNIAMKATNADVTVMKRAVANMTNKSIVLDNLDKCTNVENMVISGDVTDYVKYVNPTCVFDYLFSAGATDLKAIESMSIANFTADKEGEGTLTVRDVVQNIYNLVVGSFTKMSEEYFKYSIDYIIENELQQKVFDEVMLYVWNWHLIFPMLDQAGKAKYYMPHINKYVKDKLGNGIYPYIIFDEAEALAKKL